MPSPDEREGPWGYDTNTRVKRVIIHKYKLIAAQKQIPMRDLVEDALVRHIEYLASQVPDVPTTRVDE